MAIERALVIGSGIAGPAMAMALQKAGMEPVVFEAHPRDAGGVGAFLTVATNGIDALRAIDAHGALTAGFSTPHTDLRSSTGKFLGRTRNGVELPDGTTSQTITRSDLYRGLREEAERRGIVVHHAHRLEGIEELDDRVVARFEDGSGTAADVLIGCDGVHSTVRSLIDPRAPRPAYTGLLTTGGQTREVRIDREPGNYEMIFGRRAFFGYAVAPDGTVWWFANVPRPEEPRRGEPPRQEDALHSELLALFADDEGPASALIAATQHPSPLTPIHTLAHLPVWARGRSVVIGDAAHAPSPTSGQGASLAVEDAVVLAKNLRDLPHHSEAFAAFVTKRRPRVEGIIRAAARINNSKAPSRFGAAMRDLMLPVVLRLTANGKAAVRQYEHHLDW